MPFYWNLLFSMLPLLLSEIQGSLWSYPLLLSTCSRSSKSVGAELLAVTHVYHCFSVSLCFLWLRILFELPFLNTCTHTNTCTDMIFFFLTPVICKNPQKQASFVVQRVKAPLGMLASYIGAPIRISAALLVIQPLANAPGKAMEDSPISWAPVTQVRDPHGVPGFSQAHRWSLWPRTSGWKSSLCLSVPLPFKSNEVSLPLPATFQPKEATTPPKEQPRAISWCYSLPYVHKQQMETFSLVLLPYSPLPWGR